MPKVKISEFSSTPASNTDIDGINIAEGCAPSGINDAIRELMAQLKDFQTGAVGDSFNGPVGTSTAAAGAFTTLSATGVTTVQAGSAGAPAITTSGDTNTGIFFPAADTIAFSEGGVESARIDASGNLGLGVTPSAWSGFGLPVLELPSGGTIVSKGNGSTIGSNWYYASSQFRYSTTASASYYFQSGGAHSWHTAPSGTAGNAITFTQAMTLDSSGRLGIGASSGSAALAASANGGTDVAIMSGIAGAAYFGVVGAKPIVFESNGAERARIDSSGNLLVGTTTTRARVTVESNSSTIAVPFDSNDTRADASSSASFVFRRQGTQVGSITTTTTATAYVTSSDYRLKEDVQPMIGALSKVSALKPCTYKWKSNGSDGEGFIAHELQAVIPDAVTGEKDGTRTEQYEISPAVPATFDEEGNELTAAVEAVMGEREVPSYQGIDTSFLVATLTAAIQELKAIVDAQGAEIAALKAK
jgi:hypothetical protein